MAIESFRDLEVWQVSMQLARDSYELTRSMPKEELFGMTSQIRRASVSVPANIAEGWGRESTGDYIRFLRTSQGSVKELEVLLELARDVRLLTAEAVAPLLDQADRVGRMLRGLIRALERSNQ